MVRKAATLFDRDMDCGVEANTGKHLAAEAAFEACHTAMLTLGVMGYAQESCRAAAARSADPSDCAD